MVDTQLDHESLQSLLLRREVVNIRVGDVVGFSIQRRLSVLDQSFADLIHRFVWQTKELGVENMVVIPPVVEPHQLQVEQRLDLLWSRVHHLDDCRRVLRFPTHDEQVGIDLDVEED